MKIGIDRFNEEAASLLKGRNFILITGSSNVDSNGIPVYLSLKKNVGSLFKAIWSLQHGFFIDKQDNMVFSDSFRWDAFDIEIRSLYGERVLPDDEWLTGVEAIVVDLFDVGTRVYTFVNHVLMIMKYLSGKDLDIIVLDRPNPLAGGMVEGNVMETDYFSIVGQLPVPMRHGLTVGEYLSYGLSYYGIDLQLEVITVDEWKRNDLFTGIWTYPSPNMPTIATAVVYPGAVMLEGTNLSEGRGTTRPFEFMGAPFIDNIKLVEKMQALDFPSAIISPVFFKPEFSKFRGDVCRGILVTPTDFQTFRSFGIYYELIRLIANWYPDEFRWKEPPYEYEYKRLPIDMISGSASVRKAIEANVTFSQFEQSMIPGVDTYINEVDPFLLYK